MIQAKELRVDNYVWENYGGYYKVVNIKSEQNLNNIPYVDLKKECGLIGRYDLKSIYPIKLTKDILIKDLGFNEDYDKGWIGIDVKHEGGTTTDFVIATPFNMGEWQDFYAFVYDGSRFVRLDYVHELQNLFYDICKQELKVNF